MTHTPSVRPSNQWYQIIPPQDRAAVDAVAEWLKPVDWQWFITLTFSWNVRAETADQKFKDWVNRVERDLRNRMCFVAGKERKPDSDGMKVPWHFHVLVTSLVPIPRSLLELHWTRLVGSGRSAIVDGVAVPESILAEAYGEHRMGPEYCLKSMNACLGEWQFRWLELFNPAITKQTSRPNHRTNVQRRRFAQQKQRPDSVTLQHQDRE